MEWQFTIVQYDGSGAPVKTAIDEPPGWDSIDKTIQRDPEMHGIVFNFSAGELEFIEESYWIIKEEYLLRGVDGNIGLEIRANGEPFYSGKLDFNRYEERCGESCSVAVGLEDADSEVLIKNRMDSNIDLASNKAFDPAVTLTDYTALGRTITVPSKSLLLQAEATNVAVEGDPGYEITGDADFDLFTPAKGQDGYLIPKFNTSTLTELQGLTPSYQLDYVTDYADAPILTIQSVGIESGVNSYEVTLRFKGSLFIKAFAFNGSGGSFQNAQVNVYFDAAVYFGPGKTVAVGPSRILTSENFIQAQQGIEATVPFDFSWAGSLDMSVGEKIWPVIKTRVQTTTLSPFTPLRNLTVNWDNASFFRVKNFSTTVPTPAKTYMVHEAGSRVVENITNGAYRLRSEFYGRTDSEPYNYPANGCGALRALTNGLLLRRAVLQDNSQPPVFISLKTLFDSLNAVDCIGMGIEGNDVRIEPIKYFYSDEVIFTADGVDGTTTTVRNDRVYNQLSIGYDKYETESTNGLDAQHTKRQYRQQIKNTEAKLEKYSKIIGDGYAIEFTRRKFGTTDDWRYDQNIFFLCLNTAGEVEQGNIVAPANMFDPPTVINYAITPARMALRWFSWLSQGYRAGGDLTFSSGEGNFIARGQLDSSCALEVAPVAENDTITKAVFRDPGQAEPFSEPEKVVFTYPLGYNEFADIAKRKYGRIQYRGMPEDTWRFGWIDSLKYNPTDGEAEFTLITTRLKQ